MVPPNGLTRFSGNEDEDASSWLEAFVISTSTFTDEAVLRMFPIFLSPESPAQEWYYGLPENSVVTWSVIERKFRQRWISRAGGQAKKQSEVETAAEKFRNHRLTDEAVFGRTSVDLVAMNKVVVDWVDAHAQLGVPAKLDDETLIQATMPHLPAFLRAFLKSLPSPPTKFQMLCKGIREITDEVLEFEWFRRQEASSDWQAKTEKRLDELSKSAKMTGVEEDETNSFLLPEQWKNTRVSIDKAGMVESVKELIGTICKYKQSDIASDAANMINTGLLHYYNAIKTPVQFHSTTIAGSDQPGHDAGLWKGIFHVCHQQTFNEFGNVAPATNIWAGVSNTSGTFICYDCIYKSHHTTYSYLHNSYDFPLSETNKQYYGGFVQFSYPGRPSMKANSFGTTLYFLLSVYLAENVATSNSAYKQAAIDSANWIIKWALDQQSHLVNTFIWELYTAQNVRTSSLSVVVTGLFIEGLCVLHSVTGEQKWGSLATDICDAAMVHPGWHSDEGIFNYVSDSGTLVAEDTNNSRGLLARGLSVAYQRNPTNKRLRHTIRSYINMQFNALRGEVHSQLGSSYAVLQNGPHRIPYAHGDIAVLDVLMAAVIVNHC